ncbi:MAG: ribonuclease P protein component [Alistipes sp.]|nr:ribonuclease P protein component [Alistipes sp.]
MPDYTLPRAERLRSLKAIRRMFDEGHSGFVYPFRYVSLVERADAKRADAERADTERLDAKGADAESPDVEMTAAVETIDAEARRVEVMFSVPKKFHKRANRRNLLKRRAREAYRLHREPLRERLQQQGATLRVALIYSTKECHTYKTISYAVQRILEQISQRL